MLYHRDVLILANSTDQKSYVELLANAATDWKSGDAHELVVAFDPVCELKLRAVVHES